MEMFIAAGANVNAQRRKNKQPFERHRSADINMWWNGWLLAVGDDIDAADEEGNYSSSSDNHFGINFKWLNFFWRTWAHVNTLNVIRQSELRVISFSQQMSISWRCWLQLELNWTKLLMEWRLVQIVDKRTKFNLVDSLPLAFQTLM
jgi:hypothetical protein